MLPQGRGEGQRGLRGVAVGGEDRGQEVGRVSVWMGEAEREREQETEREIDRQTERERERKFVTVFCNGVYQGTQFAGLAPAERKVLRLRFF